MTTIDINRKLVKTINFYNDGTYEEVPMAHIPSGMSHLGLPNFVVQQNRPSGNAVFTITTNTQNNGYTSLSEYLENLPSANGITIGPADC